MSPWPLLRHERTVRRLCDWRRLFGTHHPAWTPLLQAIDDPIGLRFLADFGTGEGDFELSRDGDGFVAIPLDGVTPHRLNATEAEFARVDLVEALRAVAAAAAAEGPIESLGHGGPYALGKRSLAGSMIALLGAPRGISSIQGRDRSRLAPHPRAAEAGLLLVPDVASVATAVREEFAAMRVALAELPDVPPWQIDWSALVEDDRFGVPLTDPSLLFGARYAIVVDPMQEKIWLEGRELKVKADGQSYRLLVHLAERPRTGVPVRILANQVLEPGAGDRLENKIVSDAKYELMAAIRTCLTPAPDRCRIDTPSLITLENARVTLNIDPSLVRLVRRFSEQQAAK